MDKKRALELAKKCSMFSSIDKIIITDNCSPDDSYQWLQENTSEDIDIIQSDKNGGFSYGNNFGAKYAINTYHPDYLLFANTDTIFTEDDVSACLNTLKQNESLGLVSLRMVDINGKEEASCWKHKTYLQMLFFCLWLYRKYNFENFYYDLKNEQETLKYVDVVRGSFMCFKTIALQTINFFDDNTFLYYEEDITSKRLQRSSYKIGILTNHFYIHNHIELAPPNRKKRKQNLDKSMYYFLCNYYNINFLQKFFVKLVINYSRVEEWVISFLK